MGGVHPWTLTQAPVLQMRKYDALSGNTGLAFVSTRRESIFLKHTAHCGVRRTPTGRTAIMAWVNRGALLSLFLASSIAFASEPAELPQPGSLLPSETGCCSRGCLKSGSGAMPFQRPCVPNLPCAPGAQLFSRPCPLCLPGGEGAQPFRRPCPCGLPDGPGAQLYRRPCCLCLPVGLGAQLFSRHCAGSPQGTDACTPP